MKRQMPFFCLVCGVDSGPIRNFLILFIGALVGTSIMFLLWALATGRLRDRTEISGLVFEAEKRETEDPHE